MLTVAMIRARYPDVSIAPEEGGDGYCVGGAFCAVVAPWEYLNENERPGYPSHEDIADCLQDANPALTEADALRVAWAITEKNDTGDFEGAWWMLGVALAWREPVRVQEEGGDDLRLTVRLAEGGKLLGCEVLDHLILGAGRFVSLRERGKLG